MGCTCLLPVDSGGFSLAPSMLADCHRVPAPESKSARLMSPALVLLTGLSVPPASRTAWIMLILPKLLSRNTLHRCTAMTIFTADSL